MILLSWCFVCTIAINSYAQDVTTVAPSTTSSSSSTTTSKTVSTTKDLVKVTTLSNTKPRSTDAGSSDIIGDVGKMIDSFITLSPIPMSDLFGNLGQPFTLPPIDLNKILKAIPSLPPIQLPSIDPQALANLPTLGPIEFPTLDPDFFKNLPTIAPIQFPTLDPDFFKNLPTLPPFEFPTIDPDFFKNLPTLAPIQLPTLDPDFFKNLPTLPPIPGFPTMGPISFPGFPFNDVNKCLPKLLKFARDNATFQDDLIVYAKDGQALNGVLRVVEESKIVCSDEESVKLAKFIDKHRDAFSMMDKIAPSFTEEERMKVFNWMITQNILALSRFSTEKGLQNIFNPNFNVEMMNISLRISGMQLELLLNPI